MAIEVEILVFPGLPNPRYVMSVEVEREFHRRLISLSPAARSAGSADTRTGYRGLRVRVIDDDQFTEQIYTVFGGLVRGAPSSLADADRQLERWLFDGAPQAARERAQLPFDQLIESGPPDQAIDGVSGLGLPGECREAPAFPASPPETIWERKATSNNCYNYALNLPAGNWALPGGISHPLPCARLVELVEADGPRHLVGGFEPVCGQDSHLILLCLVNPREFSGNFHFLRLDRNGIWSHKFGHAFVTNRDEAGQSMAALTGIRFRYRLVACAVFEYARPLGRSVMLA